MTSVIVIDEITVSNELGESVLWDNLEQAFWWTDIEGRLLFRYYPESKQILFWETPYRLASFGLIENDRRLIAAFDRGVALYDFDKGLLDWLTPKSFLPPGHRLNDGRVDRDGNFCVGSMIEDEEVSTELGKLFLVSHDRLVSTLLTGIQISNGLSWSADGSRMFHADSPGGEISTYDYSELKAGGHVSESFARCDHGEYPDGAAIDSTGCLWSANWGGSSVTQYAPTGDKLMKVDLPVSQPTCVAFGGANLDLMMVTSARQGLSDAQLADEPSAGNALLLKTEVVGLPEPRFVLSA